MELQKGNHPHRSPLDSDIVQESILVPCSFHQFDLCYSHSCRIAYLHDGLEPKVVHRDIKSSNILLDSQWNPKVSDFGLAKLLCSERSYVTTRVMGTFGYGTSVCSLLTVFPFMFLNLPVLKGFYCFTSYVAPEYACTGMLNEKSDIYSFGILIMEIITGRNPVDYSRPKGEVGSLSSLPYRPLSCSLSDFLLPRPLTVNNHLNCR